MRSRIGKATIITVSTVLLAFVIILWIVPKVQAALTIDPQSNVDWNACAQNTVEECTVITTSGNYYTSICIQAFLDSATPHTGTEFIIQASSADSGDEISASYVTRPH